MKAPTPVLLVEDDPDDIMLMRKILEEIRAPVELMAAPDGLRALEFLRGKGRPADAARPALVLLDWRLPGKGGLEVLRDIRADAALRRLPVIVLTTSSSEHDVAAAYEAGANCFVTKPTGLAGMRALAAAFSEFWLVHAQLPV